VIRVVRVHGGGVPTELQHTREMFRTCGLDFLCAAPHITPMDVVGVGDAGARCSGFECLAIARRERARN